MPAGNGTGPMGMGPMTGRAAGYCAGYLAPGFALGFWGRGYYPYSLMHPMGYYGTPYLFPFVSHRPGWSGRRSWRGRGRWW